MRSSASDILSAFLMALCLLLTAWSTAAGAAGAAEQQIESIQQLYRSLTSLSFDFRQTTRNGGGRDRHGAGSSVFYRPEPGRPGIMRWNYAEPDVQVILNDGKKLSVYTQKDRQLLVSSAAELESDITYSFFAGSRNVLDDFDVQPLGDGRERLQAALLVPRKPHGQIKLVQCWFDAKSAIRKLVLEDHFDTVTELTFANIIFNALPAGSSKTAEELVRLDLPPDTEIVRQ